jgi:hypothetical protein
MRRALATTTLMLTTALGAACGIGKIGETGDEANGDVVRLPDGGTAPAFAPSSAHLKRLTVAQYGRTIHELFGLGIKIPTDLEVDTKIHGFTTIGSSELTIGPRAAEQFEAAAFDLARQVFADTARRDSFVGCAPTSATDPCIKTFLQKFGRRAWRRPLTDAELTRWSNVVADVSGKLGSVWVGLEHATAGLLQSPHFLFRVELGVPDASKPGRLRYDDHEMASRLSFFLWGSTPDDALLDAADRGELATVEGVRAQANRMVSSTKARSALRGYFAEYLNLERLELLTKDATVFPEWNRELGVAMREEIERAFEDVAFDRNADYRTIFTSNQTYTNTALAKIYGLPDPGPGFSRVVLPDDGPRAGLLGMAGILALYAHATITSPTLRGRFVRTQLLCQDIPPPPPGVVTSIEDDGVADKTVREKLAAHRKDPTCNSCHRLMDPLGLGMEDFDPIGRHRTMEGTKPVDASGELDGKTFTGGKELGKVLASHPEIGGCQVRNLYRYATGHLEGPGEVITIAELAQKFEQSGYKIKSLLVDIVTSDGFRYAAEGGK